ncbi:hypothetical protein E2C01_098380 [Portunus trituberculatus]|uniref:Uncharacterized protein n=1 Tax=Portunus trituberculatus TaxID=210409 RepID=A0A5B7K7H9_PORTR|nr:hypothetical protein [Portunus trituberculatus]
MISFVSSSTTPPIMDPDIDAKSRVTVCKTLSPPRRRTPERLLLPRRTLHPADR